VGLYWIVLAAPVVLFLVTALAVRPRTSTQGFLAALMGVLMAYALLVIFDSWGRNSASSAVGVCLLLLSIAGLGLVRRRSRATRSAAGLIDMGSG